jgi:Phage head-tail joining protein
MNTGALRHHVTLDVPNGETGSFTPLNPPDWWCGHLTETTGEVTLFGRYHPGITTATRVHFKGRVYHVTALSNRADRDAELVLSCTEVFS